MTFPRNAYAVLELPTPAAEEVLAIRERERDHFRWSLMAETTISGSGGTGTFATDEDPERIYSTVDRIAAETVPIRASFGPVRRFPGTDVFYLSFADEAPLRALNQRFAASGLRFEPVPFPFVPHVTLRSRVPISDAEAAELLAVRVSGEFTFDALSLYQLVWREPPSDRFEPCSACYTAPGSPARHEPPERPVHLRQS